MANNTPKVPQIRFKGFTDAWVKRKLGECATFSKGIGYSKNDLIKYGTPIILYGRLYTKFQIIISDIDTYVIPKKRSLYSTGNEVIVPASGETPEDIARASFVSKLGILIGGDLNVIYPHKFLNPIVLALIISYGNSQRNIITKAQGKSVVHLHNYDLYDVEILFPRLKEEQEKVGRLFNELDIIISLYKQKHEKLQNVKKALLEKMFPKNGDTKPQIRFKGFTDAWVKRKLGECGNTQSGIGFPNSEQGKRQGIPFFKISDMNNIGNEIQMQVANNYVSLEQINRKKWNPINTIPAIIFAKVGAAIMLNRKRLVTMPFLIDNNMMAYIFDYSWDVDFGYTLIETLKLYLYAQVGALPSYNSSDIENIVTNIPPLRSEQSKIGIFFKHLDELISLYKQKHEKLQNVKKALLEKMFV